MQRQQTVFVKNNGAEPFSDRYNGEDFKIPPGGIEEMLVETAELCLGFGQDDKTRCLRRLGWAFTMEDMPEALERLGQFSFHMTEKEARGFNPTNSSAPVGNETPAAPKGAAGGVAAKNKGGRPKKTVSARTNQSVLEKLAHAQAPAGS